MDSSYRHIPSLFALFRSVALFCLMAVIPPIAPARAQSPVDINIPPRIQVEEEEILLGDIADIKGADHEMRRRLEAVVVGRSPQPGDLRTIDPDSIRLRLKQYDVELSQVNLQSPEKIEIRRESNTVTHEAIETAVRNHLREHMPWNEEEVRIDAVKINQDVVLPTGKLTLDVASPRQTRYLGAVPVSVSFYVDGRFEKKIWVNTQISVFTDVVVVKKGMGRYQRITEADLMVTRMDLAEVPGDAVLRMEDAVGMRTARSLYPKTVLRTGFIELPPLVNRGDIVRILYEKGPLQVTARGMIKEKGRKDERVRVVNIDSDKIIYARVVSPGMVKVDF